ncbi:hypothetical protein BGZ95_000409 [Linnemannia exigua]|uniref:Uncharacterized protein n=1 Tax=Linnemannia exigua TaxID=604196 RepID=A0AAD4H4D4_9FUNG|nr:hypothetical protein BGZ95_000409 [Linnemannia exigua]
MVIESLLDRIILPAMLSTTPPPVRAIQHESLRAIWIETVDHEFSAQRASETAKTLILNQVNEQEPHKSIVEESVEVTTLPVQLSYPEEKAPSILMTSSVKPGLGSSWRHATDLQLFLSRMEMIGDSGIGNNLHGEGHSRVLSESEADVDMSVEVSAEEVVEITADTRIAEVMKSKRLTAGEWCVFQLKS